MLLLMRRHFWILGVGVAVVCALLAHAGWEQLAAAGHIELPEYAPLETTPSIAAPTPAAKKDGDVLIDRNIFCSTCSPLEVEPSAAVAGDLVPLTKLPLELLATSLAGLSDASFATVRHATSGQQGAYWVGDRLPSAGPIEAVHGTVVVFYNPQTHRLERLSLLAELAPKPSSRAAASAKPAGKAGPYADRIQKSGDHRFAVEASLVAELTANPMAIKGVRFMPHMADGKMAGFKLRYARKNSIATAMGLRRGDVVQSINGNELSSADALLGIYTKLRNQSSFQVTIVRGGKPVTLSYDVR